MIRDLFVSKDVKDLYKQKPISITKFIKLFEKNTGIKVYKDIKYVLKKMYYTSYGIDQRSFVCICGSDHSGKSLLSELITLYDVLRYKCLKHKSKIRIAILSHYPKNSLYQDLASHDPFILKDNDVSISVITESTEHVLFGHDVSAVVDDNITAIDSHLEFIATSKFLDTVKTMPIGMFHYISTMRIAQSDKTKIERETIRFKIYLKDRKV